jgi:hypothetical protein
MLLIQKIGKLSGLEATLLGTEMTILREKMGFTPSGTDQPSTSAEEK